MKRYFILWWLFGIKSAKIAFQSRFGAGLLILGKILRFSLFLFFILLIASNTKTIVGYSLWQVVLFFATFNVVDILAQIFLREVYHFRKYVVSGDFDYFLAKPLSPLFRSLMGGSDILDLPMLALAGLLLFIAASQIGNITLINSLIYILLIVNSLVIALSFHIFVLAICVMTTEIDNMLWAYRDLTQLGKMPIDIFREPLRGFLTFVLPVGITMTYPAKALMGLLSFSSMSIAFGISTVFLLVSVWSWQYALRRYSSASS